MAGKHFTAHLAQQSGVTPGRLGHDVMQRLMHLPYVWRSQTRRLRLDAFVLDGKKKTFGLVLHGNDAIGVSATCDNRSRYVAKRSD
jgi:hypothetical protein